MDSSDLVTAVLGRVVERIPGDTLGRLVGDELDGLDDTVDDLLYLSAPSRTCVDVLPAGAGQGPISFGFS